MADIQAGPASESRKAVRWFVWLLFGLAALFVLGILAVIAMLLVMPRTKNVTKSANEIAAQSSLRAIAQAELEYSSTFPANGFACSLAALGGDPGAGAPSATGAQILQGDLASGVKAGYKFSLACTGNVTESGVHRFTSYSVTAVPITVGETGNRGFCSDQDAVIKVDTGGGANCTQSLP